MKYILILMLLLFFSCGSILKEAFWETVQERKYDCCCGSKKIFYDGKYYFVYDRNRLLLKTSDCNEAIAELKE